MPLELFPGSDTEQSANQARIEKIDLFFLAKQKEK